MPSSRYRFVMFFCIFHCCFIHERGSGPPISAPYSFCLGIVCRHHKEKKTTTKSGRQKWGGLGEEARARETGRENHACQINDASGEGCCANCIASPTHLAYQGERGADRVVTGLGNIEPILDPVYIEAMVERLLRVQCALYTVYFAPSRFTHPRDQVRSAGPLNQFLIVLSSSPNFSKTLYLTQTQA